MKRILVEKAYKSAFIGEDISKNENIVLASKSYYSFYFARDIKGADIKKHEDIILNIDDNRWSFLFAKSVKGANIEKHFKKIFHSKDQLYINLFIEQVNYKGTKVEEWILYI